MDLRITGRYCNEYDNFFVSITLPRRTEAAYLIDFNTRKVFFYQGEADLKRLFLRGLTYEDDPYHMWRGHDTSINSSFSEADMEEKIGVSGITGTVMSCIVGRAQFVKDGKELELIAEYLDTTNGKLPKHSHPNLKHPTKPNCTGKVREAYLNADSPYGRGEVCGYGEFHEPFTDHTIAIKVIVWE